LPHPSYIGPLAIVCGMAAAIRHTQMTTSTIMWSPMMTALTGTPLEALLRYREARDGDHLLTTFQCDLYCFCNLQLRDPVPDFTQDNLLLCAICQATLDSLWGREPHTVNATLWAAKSMMQQWNKVGLAPQFPPLGPLPVRDSLGLRVAVACIGAWLVQCFLSAVQDNLQAESWALKHLHGFC
jgi:hypothetical protein